MDKRLISSLRGRMPWTIASRLIRLANAPTSQGWDRTEQRLAEFDDAHAIEGLLDSYHQHILCGEKLTKFYLAPRDAIEKLRSQIADLEPSESAFLEKYPLSLNEEELSNLNGNQYLCEIIKHEDGIGAVYCSMIRITTREIIDFNDIVENSEELHALYDEIVGFKYKPVQLYNVIWIPHEGNIIEIRTDNPKGMSQDLSHAIHSNLKNEINEISESELITDPIDLFPLIESMYNDEKEGQVVELGFSTATASIKNEKMRRSGTCLRQEIYHQGGKQALSTPIEPFRISLRWQITRDGQETRPELGLFGTSRGRHTVGSGSPKVQIVSAAQIINCSGVADYEHVKERISLHIARLHQNKSGV